MKKKSLIKHFLLNCLLLHLLLINLVQASEMLDNGQLSNEIHINDSLGKFVKTSGSKDKFNFGVAKFILAGQKEITKELLKSKIELLYLHNSFASEKIDLPEDYDTKYDRALFPDFYRNIDSFKEAVSYIYNEEDLTERFLDLTKKATELVILDAQIMDWRFNIYPSTWRDKKAPNDTQRNFEIQALEAQRSIIASEPSYRMLFVPIYENFTYKRAWEFFFFNSRPGYYFYQYLYAGLYHLDTEEKPASIAPFLGVKNTTIQIARSLNVFAFEPEGKEDQADPLFKQYKKSVSKLKADVRSFDAIVNQPNSSHSKKILTEYIKAAMSTFIKTQIKILDRALNDLKMEPNMNIRVDDPYATSLGVIDHNPFSFSVKNKKFIETYSFLYTLGNLKPILSTQYRNYEDTFNPLQLHEFSNNLREVNINREKQQNNNTMINILYGAGFGAMFIPLGNVLSPVFYGAGAITSITKSAFNYSDAKRNSNFMLALNNPFRTGESDFNLDNNELHAAQKILQERKYQLTFSIAVEAPLALLPMLNLLHQFKTGTMALNYKTSIATWFKELGGANATKLSTLGKLGHAGLAFVKDSNVQIAATYFAFISGWMIYEDIKRGEHRPDYKLPKPQNALTFENTLEFLSSNKKNQKLTYKIIQGIYNHLEDSDKFHGFPYSGSIYRNSYLRNPYLDKYAVRSDELPRMFDRSVLKVYDGDRVIKIFDSIYIPLSLIKSSKNDAESIQKTVEDITPKVAQTYFIQSIIENDIITALLEDSLIKFLTESLNGDYAANQYEINVLGETVALMFNQKLMAVARLSLSKEELSIESSNFADKYKVRR